MTDDRLLIRLKYGVWNQWREENPGIFDVLDRLAAAGDARAAQQGTLPLVLPPLGEMPSMEQILNRDLLPNNQCFGCGLENPAGLRIEVTRDPGSAVTLRALFIPSPGLAGFPGITHGGAIYTALDCLSTWVSTLLGPNREAAWVLRAATTTYHKPAPPGQPLTLVGTIKQMAGAWDPLIVTTQARRFDGELCVEAEFKVVPLSPEKFTAVAGIPELPANWRLFLSGAA